MRPLALLPLGVGVGLAVEWATYEGGSIDLVAADLAVGIVLIGGGAVAWERRPESRVGAIMVLAGLTWFVGTAFEPALFLHRGPLVHLFLSYPTGRLPSRVARVVVAAAYLVSAVEPLSHEDAVTIVLAAAVALVAVREFASMSGTARKARGPALAAALAFAVVLAAGAAARRGGWEGDAVLWAYDAVVAASAIALVVDLSRSRWADAVVTGLVVDLGAPDEVATLRGKLARALGDPSLVVGYRLHETGGFVDDAGRPVELPAPASGISVTAIEDDDERIAVLVHDEALLADPNLVESVAAAARIAVANAHLQAEARARAEELDASRRRIVEAADAQRRRLEEELRLGAKRRLDSVAALLADARKTAAPNEGAAIAALEADLDAARDELREFALGVHPAALTERGLMPALALLAERSPIPVEVRGELGRIPAPVEATLYFVCSEALANATKHSEALRMTIDVRALHGGIMISIADDGVGGADPSGGTGLRGLADRVEALGGKFRVESPPGAGTRVVTEIPLD